MNHFYKATDKKTVQLHFYIESKQPLSKFEMAKVVRVLRDSDKPEGLTHRPAFRGRNVTEIGPRRSFETPHSSNGVTIFRALGITKIRRVEMARRVRGRPGDILNDDRAFDRKVEEIYRKILESFETGKERPETPRYPILEKGIEALIPVNKQYGFGMDMESMRYFVEVCRRRGKDPFLTTIAGWANATSEHCRHGFLFALQKIDGKLMRETLFELVRKPLEVCGRRNCLLAFDDNVSAMRGFRVERLVALEPDKPSETVSRKCIYHLTFTAETHNHPCLIAAYQGGLTDTGGRERDNVAGGRGSLMIASTALFHTGELHPRGYRIPGEHPYWTYNYPQMKPKDILIEASDGVFGYANEVGEPCILIRVRTGGYNTPWEGRRESLKPVIYSGGIGKIQHVNLRKRKAREGMYIVQFGGGAFPVGFAGGAASSLIGGVSRVDVDLNSVQRGDGEMGKKMFNIVRSCSEQGIRNPFVCIHDQGAGGVCNIISELIYPAGGKIYLARIRQGDKTMSETEIFCAEYQERVGVLVYAENLALLKRICKRENCPMEVLGRITGDGKFTVIGLDGNEKEPLVDLTLRDMLKKLPQRTFESNHIVRNTIPPSIPRGLTVRDALQRIAKMPEIGFFSFLRDKVDGSVGGLVARGDCCGELQLPVSPLGVVAFSHKDVAGGATSMGQSPNVLLLDPGRGARKSFADMVLSIMWVLMTSPLDINCRVNWMGPVKLPGEGADLYDSVTALSDAMIKMCIPEVGGKDSSSLALKMLRKLVKSMMQIVIAGYVTVPDIRKVITPDLKAPGKSTLYYIDLSGGKKRLGGSALLKSLDQIGDDAPDVNFRLLKSILSATQDMIREGAILSGNLRTDGGIITTLVKMALSGNCGIDINMKSTASANATLFNEECGVVVECANDEVSAAKLKEICKRHKLPLRPIGTTKEEKRVRVAVNGRTVLNEGNGVLRGWFEATSARLSEEQVPPELAREELRHRIAESASPFSLRHHLSFVPTPTLRKFLYAKEKPWVAVIRDEGSNGEVEMHDALKNAGFRTMEVHMTDLLYGLIDLSLFRGVVFVGGFSHRDTFGSARGWAEKINQKRRLKKMFDEFYARPDTFSLGVCNGCQLEPMIGWVPFKDAQERHQPRFKHNRSGKFEARWVRVRIQKSPSIMLSGMEGSILGAFCAHGEGRLVFPNAALRKLAVDGNLVPIVYVDPNGTATEAYPYNPNGSEGGFAALTSPDGRHLAFMLHPERTVRLWQIPHLPKEWQNLISAPWLRMFQNAREWCDKTAVWKHQRTAVAA
ncbi:MAG: phosphoribosylformylglycinamidine synthase [Candidatus Pacebacteria bacterium]|nr:phosphoribosylformylglycinamidine synthase [Candidatus Paceibacterota bacterium]